MIKGTIIVVFVICFGSLAMAQAKPSTNPRALVAAADSIRSSPAYAELLLRKTELTAELESLALEYTDEFPKIREAKFAVALLERDLTRLAATKATDAGKLTLALGKLMLRRVEVETELGLLQKTYKDEHPDVKRLKRKLEIFDSAVKEILD